MRRRLSLLLALAAIGSAAGPARADDQIIGLLDVEVEGVSAAAAEAFEKSLEDGISGTGFKVASRKRLAEMLAPTEYVDGCLFGPCLSEVYRVTEVRLVLVARISGAGRSYSFVATLIDAQSGTPTSQVSDTCTPCTVDEAMGTATLAVIALVTGTGTATVIDPQVGPTGDSGFAREGAEAAAAAARERVRLQKRSMRRTGYFFLGAAAIAAGVSAWALSRDDSEVAYPTAAAGGTLAVAAGALFVLSVRY